MTKLKTLKDIEIEGEEYPEESDMMDRNQIKQEAIKWVKYSESREKVYLEEFNQSMALSHRTTILWIMKFFNITEEDLQ